MLIDDIALTMLPEVGTKTAIHLLECFGTAEAVFAASVDELTERAELKLSIAQSISRKITHSEAAEELGFAQKHNIRVICSTSPEYPQRLKECPDYPHLLYVMGDLDLNSSHWLSIVGTRNITPYGIKMCEMLIQEIAANFPQAVIVSGLAYGVDIAAHRAAMQAGLATVGIVAHSLTHIYPPRHTDSARRMVKQGGAVISEFNRTDKPDKSGFVQRNRIIAGLSTGTLIVESAARGGSLITAEMADGYHRTVMAVPGRVGEKYSEGTNNLIKNLRAQMVCTGSDIADLLDWVLPAAKKTAKEQQLNFSFLTGTSGNASENTTVNLPGKQPATGVAGEVFAEGKASPENGNGRSPEAWFMSNTPEPGFISNADLSAGTGAGPEAERDSGWMLHPNSNLNTNANSNTNSMAGQLLALIDGDVPVSLDDLSIRTSLPVGSLAIPLLELELAGRIHALPGKHYILK